MSDHDPSRLHDLVDGLLSDGDHALVQAHLLECPKCRDEVESLRALLARAASLPDSIEPPRDLWPGIVERVRPAAPRPRFARPALLLAAAVLLVGATALVTHVADRRPPELVAVSTSSWEHELLQASDALEHAFTARRDDLSPETVSILDTNLRIIDQAIEECRFALETDPSNPRLEGSLREAWQRRLRVLEHASRLPPNS